MWEVFRWSNGVPVVHGLPDEQACEDWINLNIALEYRGNFDYARTGEGWD